MELKELYEQIDNPMEDKGMIERLVSIYASDWIFYDGLTNYGKKVNSGESKKSDSDKFFALLFNKWKNRIVARDTSYLKSMNYSQDYIKMKDYLSHISDVKTEKEGDEILFGQKDDKELEEALAKYNWTALSDQDISDWIHVHSNSFNKERDTTNNTEHRLYINIDLNDLYEFMNHLMEKFDKYKLPYYFKFCPTCCRDDSLVIYSSTENLMKYIDILYEIKRDHPSLISRMYLPPLLTGKIDGWIGYGSEPARLPGGKRTSFNEVRAKIIEEAISDVTKKWIFDNKDKIISYRNQKITVAEYYANKVVDCFISNLESSYHSSRKRRSDSEVISRLGYSLNDVRNSEFRKRVYNSFYNQIDSILEFLCLANQEDSKIAEIRGSLTFNMKNGKKVQLLNLYMNKGFKIIAPEILSHDPNYLINVHDAIINKAVDSGIDVNKFCVDIAARDRMREVSSKRRNTTVDLSHNKMFRRELDKSILTNIKQKIINYLRTNGLSNVEEVIDRMNSISNLYVEKLVECEGAKMIYDGKNNEIAIDIQFVQFDKNNNPIGLEPNLSKLIESQLGHELLHSASKKGKGNGILNTKKEIGLIEGLTQLITENIFGYTVSKNTDGYQMLKKFAKVLEATFGKSCILESYFGNSCELKNKLDFIKPNYYITFNKYLKMAYSCDSSYNLDKFYELLMRDVVINIVLPALKNKSPDEANKYIKNIALYFKDDYKTAMDFLRILNEYNGMDDQNLINKKEFVERDIDKEYTRIEFYQNCLKDDVDISKFVTISSNGNVLAHYKNKNFLVTNEIVLLEVFAKYYEQVIINDSSILVNVDRKIEDKLANHDYKINFSDSAKGDIVYKKAVFAYYKKTASKKGININNSLDDIEDEDVINLDVINLNDENRFDFYKLRDMLDKYDFVNSDVNNSYGYEIIDKETKKVVKNPQVKSCVAFAYLWLRSFGTKRFSGEKYMGETYAFSKISEEAYNEMCELIKESMMEYGTIDVDFLIEKLEKNRNVGGVLKPLSAMFKNPLSTEIVYKYFHTLIPKENRKLETETTKIFHSHMIDYQGVIEAKIDEIIPSNNKHIYEELRRELSRDYWPGMQVKSNFNYYKEFVAASDGVANAISIDNDILVADAMIKLNEAENKIAKVDIKNLDLAKASEDQIIQQNLARMKRALKNRDIDAYNMYRDKYNSMMNGQIIPLSYH